jgi:hypothetical protein
MKLFFRVTLSIVESITWQLLHMLDVNKSNVSQDLMLYRISNRLILVIFWSIKFENRVGNFSALEV